MRHFEVYNGGCSEFWWELIDDGTMDDVIRITLVGDSDIGNHGEIFVVRFSPYAIRDENSGRIEHELVTSELDRWADEIIESRS